MLPRKYERLNVKKITWFIITVSFILTGCAGGGNPVIPSNIPMGKDAKIIFLHHSTGAGVWGGGVPEWFTSYNSAHETEFSITELAFPKDLNSESYGWNNYPYDYWNIWVNNEGDTPYMDEPTLEILTQQYDVIIWKHCFPGADISVDSGGVDITSADKELQNYKLQYNALKEKMHEFPETRFIVWTLAARISSETNTDNAKRARQFTDWVKNTWDEPGDNIFIWDFFELETGGGNTLIVEYAASSSDSHPDSEFNSTVAPYFSQRIVDVIEGRGDTASLTGE